MWSTVERGQEVKTQNRALSIVAAVDAALLLSDVCINHGRKFVKPSNRPRSARSVRRYIIASTDSIFSTDGVHTSSGAHLASCTWCVQILRSPKEAFAAAMQSLRERCEKCVCLQGDYVEK